MTVRKAEPKDLDGLCAMVEHHVSDMELPLTYCHESTRQIFHVGMHDDRAIMLVFESGGVLAGGVRGFIDSEFYNERLAYITEFWVEREFRGTWVARELVAAFESEAVAGHAKVVMASATAAMGPRTEWLFVRLFEKRGYNVLGRVLVKELS